VRHLLLALFTDEHPCAPVKFQRIRAVYDLRVLRQLWCNPESVSQRRFFTRRLGARICHRALARTPSEGHATLYPMISLDRFACCAYGAHAALTEDGRHQRPRCSVRIIIILWTVRLCRRRQCWLWLKHKHATGPASAPKLRQNRIKCSKRPQSTI
jgi:hypothetical protein